jgi:general secretion pathway protein C
MKYDLHFLFSQKYTQWFVVGFIVLFSLLIVYEYSTLFFSSGTVQTIPKNNESMQVIKKDDSMNALLSSSLFGVYVSNNLTEIKKSMLNVTLVGILFANTLHDSQVIIRSANGEEKNYKLGDEIPGGAIIKRILANGILVEHEGNIESLTLPKNDLTFEPVAKPLKEE